jgi:hypothetical protein
MDKPHVNLIIATPGHSLMADYVKSLLATSRELSNRGITWIYTNGYASHVADAREITLSGTFKNEIANSNPLSGQITYDKILWIDSDIAWDPEDVIKLYESDKDVVSGAYLFASGEVAAYEKFMGSGYSFDDIKDKTEIMEIDGCGFGFVCVKPGIFESLTRPWFQSAMVKLEQDGKEYEFPVMGEDISWCMRVKEKGYEIWLDPTVQVTHHKTMKLTWKGIQP